MEENKGYMRMSKYTSGVEVIESEIESEVMSVDYPIRRET